MSDTITGTTGYHQPLYEWVGQQPTTFTFAKVDTATCNAHDRLMLAVLECQEALLRKAIYYLNSPTPVMASEQIELALELEKLK